MKLETAAKIIRRELLVKDQPLKAYNLLKELGMNELKGELENTKGMVNHLFDKDKYIEIYSQDTAEGAENIEPFDMADKADLRYPRYRWVLDNLHRDKVKTYCDLACYVGSLPLTAAKRGIKSVGVDLTKKVIDIARDRADKLDIKNIKFYFGNVLTFDKGKYEAVSALEVLEHVPSPVEFIKHLLGLIEDGGHCYITTPDGSFGNGEGNLGHWEYDGEHTRGHVRVFKKETMEKLMEEAGAKIVELAVNDNSDGLIRVKFTHGGKNNNKKK